MTYQGIVHDLDEAAYFAHDSLSSTGAMPRCPDCGSAAWTQLDNGPLECTRCGTDWLVVGHNSPVDEDTSTLTMVVEIAP